MKSIRIKFRRKYFEETKLLQSGIVQFPLGAIVQMHDWK